MSTERFPRIAPEAMTARQREVAQAISAGPRGEVRGPFLALIHHPDLAEKLQHLGEHLRFRNSLPGDAVEFAVLVTARVWDCQYEWFAHRRVAVASTDLAPEIMDALADNRRPADMPAHLEEVYTFCQEVHANGQPGDRAYAAIEARYGKQGVLDLIALCGFYTLIAMVLNTAGIALPDGVAPPLVPMRGVRT